MATFSGRRPAGRAKPSGGGALPLAAATRNRIFWLHTVAPPQVRATDRLPPLAASASATSSADARACNGKPCQQAMHTCAAACMHVELASA